MECDDIAWLVDLLGTISLLERAIDDNVVADYSERGPNKSNLKRKRSDLADGIYFDGAHWYSIRDGDREDSYDKGYQVKGTAHFCQTFAVLIFNGTRELKEGKYLENIKVALNFWKTFFTAHAGIAKWFIIQIKQSVYKDEPLYGKKTLLKDITLKQLFAFLDEVGKNANNLYKCKEG